MYKGFQLQLSVLILILISFPNSYADYVNDITEALNDGITSAELRLGYEYSSTDDRRSPANGINLRTRLGYRTGDYFDTHIFVEFHSLSNLLEQFSFSGGGGDRNRDLIEDPDGERVHQAYFEYYTGILETQLRLGRQEIALDDERFISKVDWRQNGQSFDALTSISQPHEELSFFAAISNHVNTISLQHVDIDHLILLNAKYVRDETHNFTVFSYFLNEEIDTRDSFTFGGRTDGICADLIRYDVTYAKQEDYQGGRGNHGDFINIYVGLEFDNCKVGLGYNRISGKNGSDNPFDTLFGTAQKFNGWTDQFASTNGGGLEGGLEDIYLQISTKLMHTNIRAGYHVFDSTENEIDIHDGKYGEEFNLEFTRPVRENLMAQIKIAVYNETFQNIINGKELNPTTDEDAFWGRLIYQF